MRTLEQIKLEISELDERENTVRKYQSKLSPSEFRLRYGREAYKILEGIQRDRKELHVEMKNYKTTKSKSMTKTEAIKELLSQGKSVKEIADKVGVIKQFVYNVRSSLK